jgi:peptide deformylase
MLNNDYLYEPCKNVEEADFEEAKKIGLKMLQFAQKNDYLCLAANQIGYDKNVVVVRDDEGYDIYFNPELSEIPIDLNSASSADMISKPMPISLVSLPKNKVMMDVAGVIQVNAFSVAEDDRQDFKTTGLLANIWQIVVKTLEGIDPDAVIPNDYMTIRDTTKKSRNEKCPDCGKKNKRCICNV